MSSDLIQNNKDNNENKKSEYLLETLTSNSNSSFNSSQNNLDVNSENENFLISNEANLINCGLENRNGYTILKPVFSTPVGSVSSMRHPGYKSSLFSNSFIINDNVDDYNKSCCLDCGIYSRLVKCNGHCNLDICENCKQKHWQTEMDELFKMKTHLENNMLDLKNYLGKYSFH